MPCLKSDKCLLVSVLWADQSEICHRMLCVGEQPMLPQIWRSLAHGIPLAGRYALLSWLLRERHQDSYPPRTGQDLRILVNLSQGSGRGYPTILLKVLQVQKHPQKQGKLVGEPDNFLHLSLNSIFKIADILLMKLLRRTMQVQTSTIRRVNRLV